jgi:hypothetical protein
VYGSGKGRLWVGERKKAIHPTSILFSSGKEISSIVNTYSGEEKH